MIYPGSFKYHCKRTINATQFIYNWVHTILKPIEDTNYAAILVQLRKLERGEMARRTKVVNTFEQCWEMLKTK